MKDMERKIIETAISLFREKGYENTTVAEICKRSGITKGTFYYHFANKDDITFAYYESLFTDFPAVMPELLLIDNAKEQLWRVMEYSIDNTISLSPAILRAFMLSDIQRGLNFFSPYRSMNSSELRKQQHELQVTLVRKGQEKGEIREGDPEELLLTFVAALIGIAIDWASNGGEFDEKAELRKVFNVVF